MERQRLSIDQRNKRVVTFSASLLLIVTGITAESVYNRLTETQSTAAVAKNAFEKAYTNSGECLHNTAYNPADGAFVNLNYDQQSQEDILTVVPRDANAYVPSVLDFTWNNNHLMFADYQTGGLLVKDNCPNLPKGY